MNENEIKTGIGSGGDSLNNLFVELRKNQAAKQTPPPVLESQTSSEPTVKPIVTNLNQSTENEIVGGIVESIDGVPPTQQTKEPIDPEEKQRVLDVLLPFYQEQAGETTDQKVLQGLIDDKKKILQEALEDIDTTVHPEDKGNENKLIEMQFDNNYEEIVIGNTNKEGENQAYSNDIFIECLNKKITTVSDPQEKEPLQAFANKFSKNEEALHKHVEKINEKRIAIGKDILTLSEFSEWKDRGVFCENRGLYSQDGNSYIIDTSQNGEEFTFLNFTRSEDIEGSAQFMDLLSAAQQRLGITDDELKDFPHVVIADVQSILEEIRKTSSAPELISLPAEAQPSEDPHAVRGGENEYFKLRGDYIDLAELEEKGASKKKPLDWLIMSKERTALYEQWDKLRVKIVHSELSSFLYFIDENPHKQFNFLSTFDQKETSNVKRLLDGKKIPEKNKDTYLNIAVLLKKRNYAALQNDSSAVSAIEESLETEKIELAKIINKDVTNIDLSRLYLFYETPKPAVATSPETPPLLSQPESEEELKKRKLGAITELIEKRFDSLYDDLKVDMPDLDAGDLESEHTIHLKQYALKFARRIALEIDDELKQHIVDNINSTKENKQKINN